MASSPLSNLSTALRTSNTGDADQIIEENRGDENFQRRKDIIIALEKEQDEIIHALARNLKLMELA